MLHIVMPTVVVLYQVGESYFANRIKYVSHLIFLVYHVKEGGWEFIDRTDVNSLHWEYHDQAKQRQMMAF